MSNRLEKEGKVALESLFRKPSESVERLSRNRDPYKTQNKHVYAICCRPEEAGDAIYGENVKTLEGYALLNCEAASISSVRENPTHPFARCVNDDRPT